MGMLLTFLLLCWAVVLAVSVAVWAAGGVILTTRAVAQLARRTWRLIHKRSAF